MNDLESRNDFQEHGLVNNQSTLNIMQNNLNQPTPLLFNP